MLTIKPISQLATTTARMIHFSRWLGGLTGVSALAFVLLDWSAGIVFAAVSCVILTYLLVRRNILDITLDPSNNFLRIRFLPWFGAVKEATYSISSLTEISFIPAILEIPFLGTHSTGRHKLVVKIPRVYALEFFTSDYSADDLLILHRALKELKDNRRLG
jgi:hypothetical protein